MMQNRKLMEQASLQIPPVKSYPDGLPVYFLTGQKYLDQTLFCIQSLNNHSAEKFNYILVDDGTFTAGIIEQINKQLPGAVIITKKMIDQNIKAILPESNYPVLNYKRGEYPHIKKLTDIHTLPGNKWKLVLDSDMLFWGEPPALIKWLKNPHEPLHMVDCEESYGYSTDLMEHLAGSKISPMINVGAIGISSEAINWQNIETWIKILEEKEGKSYYLEQALSAMIIGNTPSVILNANEYIVNPGQSLIDDGHGILHHYVDLSKKGYFNLFSKK